MSWMDGLSVGLVRRALRDHQRQFFSVHRQCEKINFYRFIEIKKIRYQLKNIYYAVDCCICYRQLNAWNDTDVGRTYEQNRNSGAKCGIIEIDFETCSMVKLKAKLMAMTTSTASDMWPKWTALAGSALNDEQQP